jgi:hypothetical protein
MSTGRTQIDRRRESNRLLKALTAFGVLLMTAILIAVGVDRLFFPASRDPAGTGSGIAATQARSVPPFTAIDLAGDDNVGVRVGGAQSVTVHADSNMLSRVTTRVHSGRLVIGTSPGNLNAKSPMFVVVSVPSVDGVWLRGSGNIRVTGINGRDLTVSLSGSGNIDLTGTTSKLDVTLSGAGNALLGHLTAHDAKAALSGDGNIMLTATHSVTARISGTGTVLYGGNPRHVTRAITGSGTITAG